MKTIKKQIILLALIIGATFGAQAQLNITYSAGYGSYEMGDMSNLLDQSLASLKQNLHSGVKITDNFPSYVTHNIDLAYRFNRHEAGIKGSYYSTGGKIAYADYSGRFHEKLLFDSYRLGLMYRFHFLRVGQLLSLYGELSPAITFTNLEYDVLLEMPDYDIKETSPGADIGTIKNGYSIQPLIGLQVHPIRHLFLQASAGYDVHFGSQFNKNTSIAAEWSGFRINLGIGLTL